MRVERIRGNLTGKLELSRFQAGSTSASHIAVSNGVAGFATPSFSACSRENAPASAEPSEREWWALARRLTMFALGSALRRGEILALRWQDVEMLERRLHVRRSLVRGEFGEPKSSAGRRTIGYGPRTTDVLDEQSRASLYRSGESLVFCHPQLGKPLDPSKLSGYMRKAIAAAGIDRPIRPWHDLRHTALTHDAAAGNPAVYVQARAGHAQAPRSGCSAASQVLRRQHLPTDAGTNSGTK